jgi:hypothetical protein
VRKLIRQGSLQAFQLGRYLRISPEAVSDAERLLSPSAARPRRKKLRDSCISPTVDALVDGW